MKLWVSTDKDKRLEGYSFSEMDNFVEIETEKEPIDVYNWIVKDDILIYDPDGYNKEKHLSELEKLQKESEEIRKRQHTLEEAIIEISNAIFSIEMSELNLEYKALTKVYERLLVKGISTDDELPKFIQRQIVKNN